MYLFFIKTCHHENQFIKPDRFCSIKALWWSYWILQHPEFLTSHLLIAIFILGDRSTSSDWPFWDRICRFCEKLLYGTPWNQCTRRRQGSWTKVSPWDQSVWPSPAQTSFFICSLWVNILSCYNIEIINGCIWSIQHAK